MFLYNILEHKSYPQKDDISNIFFSFQDKTILLDLGFET